MQRIEGDGAVCSFADNTDLFENPQVSYMPSMQTQEEKWRMRPKTVGMKEQAKCGGDQSKFSLYFELYRKMALVICFSFCWKQEFKPKEKLIQFFLIILSAWVI